MKVELDELSFEKAFNYGFLLGEHHQHLASILYEELSNANGRAKALALGIKESSLERNQVIDREQELRDIRTRSDSRGRDLER